MCRILLLRCVWPHSGAVKVADTHDAAETPPPLRPTASTPKPSSPICPHCIPRRQRTKDRRPRTRVSRAVAKLHTAAPCDLLAAAEVQYYAQAQVPMRRRERPLPSPLPPLAPSARKCSRHPSLRRNSRAMGTHAHAVTAATAGIRYREGLTATPPLHLTATPPLLPSLPCPPEQKYPTQDPSCVSLPVKPSCPIITLLPRHLCPCLGPCRARGVLLILGDRGSALSLS